MVLEIHSNSPLPLCATFNVGTFFQKADKGSFTWPCLLRAKINGWHPREKWLVDSVAELHSNLVNALTPVHLVVILNS